MSESKELVLVSLPSVPADLEAAFINDEYISDLIAGIREKASSVVGDVNTVKGRGVYISMASNVRKTKTAIDDAGKALVADMKKRPAMVDASRKKVREALDELAIEIRKPATEWEAEQERIKKAEEERIAAAAYDAMRDEASAMNADFDIAKAEALKIRIESDHELALLMNKDIDRDRAEAVRLAEQQRIENEQRIIREAEEKVKRDLEEKAQREREEGIRRETELKLKAEAAERQRIEDAQRAEREKQQAIEEAQRKAQLEADRIRLETEAKETARLAEEKRIADEAAKRAADVEHRRSVNASAVQALITQGIPEDWARACVIAIARGKVPETTINY